MTVLITAGWDVDHRTGHEFSSTVVCDAACEYIADLLFHESALPGADPARDCPPPRAFTPLDIWMFG